jgi:hypothetical protein
MQVQVLLPRPFCSSAANVNASDAMAQREVFVRPLRYRSVECGLRNEDIARCCYHPANLLRVPIP